MDYGIFIAFLFPEFCIVLFWGVRMHASSAATDASAARDASAVSYSIHLSCAINTNSLTLYQIGDSLTDRRAADLCSNDGIDQSLFWHIESGI